MKKVVIVGSSRKDGGATTLVTEFERNTNWDIIDLNNYQFSYFDYDHLNKDDDFLKLMKSIIEKYDTLVFATPVYWYSMSGIMKVFFDRITDLLTIEKDLGRKLRSKKMAAISCSYGNHLGEYFWLPFSETAKYLGMEYICHAHTVVGDNNNDVIMGFIDTIETYKK